MSRLRLCLNKARKNAQWLRDFASGQCEATQVISGCHLDEEACTGCYLHEAIRIARRLDGELWEVVARLFYGYKEPGETDEEEVTEEEKQAPDERDKKTEALTQLVIGKYKRSRSGGRTIYPKG